MVNSSEKSFLDSLELLVVSQKSLLLYKRAMSATWHPELSTSILEHAKNTLTDLWERARLSFESGDWFK